MRRVALWTPSASPRRVWHAPCAPGELTCGSRAGGLTPPRRGRCPAACLPCPCSSRSRGNAMQQQELCRSCRTSLPDDRETCPRCGRVRETVAAAWTVAPPRPEETMTGPRPEPAVRPAAGRRPNGSAPAAVAAGGPAEEGWQALPVDPQD